MDISQFIKERNAALFSFNKKKILKYSSKYGVYLPPTDRDFWGGVAKAVLEIKDAPEDAKEKARGILKEYGMSENIF